MEFSLVFKFVTNWGEESFLFLPLREVEFRLAGRRVGLSSPMSNINAAENE
jgi:hypothetical protein